MQMSTTKTSTPSASSSTAPKIKSYSLGKSNPNLKLVIIPAISWTLGSSLKAIVDSTVFDLIEPLMYKIMYLTELNRIGTVKNLISKTDRGFRISHWLSSILSFITIVYLVLVLMNYYI